MSLTMERCKWCNLKNPLYIKYHDEEWGRPNFEEKYLYEILILESFQAGLSWECVLNKREYLRKRGMKFVGSTIIYSYLQAIGVIYSHDEGCFMNKKGN